MRLLRQKAYFCGVFEFPHNPTMRVPRLNASKDTSHRFPHAPADPLKWPAGCTPHRDGWVRWYAGRTIFVAGKRVPIADVEDIWIEKKREIDASERGKAYSPSVKNRTYREVAVEFITAMEHRQKTGKPRPLAVRTLHNYGSELTAFGKFIYDGQAIADLDITDANSPAVLAAYARVYGARKASGFDSIVTRISALFNWAADMEFIDRFRPGPGFQRPAKSELRDQRIDLAKTFAAIEVAKMYLKAPLMQKCWIALGVCAAFTNSDIATVTQDVVELNEGVIDFRRKKTGKVRRVIPLPSEVLAKIKAYARPEPSEPSLADRFFLTTGGGSYSTTKKNGPSCSVNRLFRKMMESAGVKLVKGRSFTGLRTTFYNLAPKGGEYELERKIIMGRAQGTVDLDSYLEDIGMDRLRHVVNHVWSQIQAEIQQLIKG